jgi:peptidyl-prolyl cis-trans isomerase D
MLQNLHEKMMGWPAKIFFGIAVFALSFFGMDSYFFSNTDTWVAKVGKTEISQQDYQTRTNDLRQQMMQQQGDQFDASYFEKPEVKQQVLDGLIDQALLNKAIAELGMVVSDVQVRSEIAAIPAFQVDGKFDGDAYRSVLAGQRMSPAMFEQRVRSDLETQLLPNAIAASTPVTRADLDAFLALRLQTRDLRCVVLPRPALTDTNVTDAQVAAYYKAHPADFMKPEQVALQYLELDAADMKVDAQPDDDTLKARYEQEKQRFVQPEQRLVSHILVKVPDNATAAQQKAALAKAQKIDAEAKAPGADFAKLAEADSDDLGSRRQGGDLGWIEKGVTNAAFESALFAMHKGEVSAPVLSPEGYHILWLRDVRAGTAKPFAEVRADLLKETLDSERERKYSEVAGKLTNLVYQDPSSLEPMAKAMNLPLKSTGLFDRNGTGTGLTANKKVLKAAFSDAVLAQGNSSDPIDLGPNHIVIVHVAEHKPAAERPLAEVSDKIKQDLLAERVDSAAHKRAQALFAKVQKGDDLAKVAGSASADMQTLDGAGRMQPGVPPALLEAAFKTPHPAKDKPQFALVPLGAGSYALLAVDAVHPGKSDALTAQQLDSLRGQMQQANAMTATRAFIDVLRRGSKIEIAKDRL